MQHFALDWKELVMHEFGTRGHEIDSKKLTDAMAAYIKYMTIETQRAGRERDVFRLLVVMTPCLEGYYRIANNIAENQPVGLNELFRTVWVVSNNSDASIRPVRKYFDRADIPDPENLAAKYKDIFREATQHEIDVFASFLPIVSKTSSAKKGPVTGEPDLIHAVVALD